MGTSPLTFDEFRLELAPVVGLQSEELKEGKLLSEELGLDSLDLFRMAVFAEDEAGVLFVDAPFPDMSTVGDVYKYYEALCAQGPPGARQ